MSAIRLPAAHHQAQPWKNGLGVSRMIAGFPRGASFDAVLWQVGSTEIGADCPFSELAGLDRLFMVIEGAGVELSCVDDASGANVRQLVRTLDAPFAFRGDWRTSCRLLDGPVRVLNVITRRGRCSAQMELLQSHQFGSLRPRAGETLLAVELASLDGWLLEGPATGIDRAALVRIRASDL